jgi:hypothetical protein
LLGVFRGLGLFFVFYGFVVCLWRLGLCAVFVLGLQGAYVWVLGLAPSGFLLEVSPCPGSVFSVHHVLHTWLRGGKTLWALY